MATCADHSLQKQTWKEGQEQLMSLWSDSVFWYGTENGYPIQPGSQRRKSNGTHIRDDQTSCCSAFLLRQALLVCSQNKNEMNYGVFGQGMRVASWTRNNQPEN